MYFLPIKPHSHPKRFCVICNTSQTNTRVKTISFFSYLYNCMSLCGNSIFCVSFFPVLFVITISWNLAPEYIYVYTYIKFVFLLWFIIFFCLVYVAVSSHPRDFEFALPGRCNFFLQIRFYSCFCKLIRTKCLQKECKLW